MPPAPSSIAAAAQRATRASRSAIMSGISTSTMPTSSPFFNTAHRSTCRCSSTPGICRARRGSTFWLGRVEHAQHSRPDVIATSVHPPFHSLDRFSVDSVVFSEPALRLLVDALGDEQVTLGSDYPYALGEADVGSLIRGASFLLAEDRTALLGTIAVGYLGLPYVDRVLP